MKIAAPPTKTTKNTVEKDGAGLLPNTDFLLHASRRIDWRFLFPDPRLQHVAYIGPADDSLAESLRIFSTALTIIEPGKLTAMDKNYETVVVSVPSYTVLEQAAGLVAPHGRLYVESYGAFLPPGRRDRVQRRRSGDGPRPRTPGGCRSTLDTHAFSDIQTYWHWPAFEACKKILPLDDEAALVYAIGNRRGGLLHKAQLIAGRLLFRSGLLPVLVPCYSLVATRSAA